MRKINISKYVAAFSVTILILIIGIILGQAISNEKYNSVSDLLDSTKTYIMSLDLQSKLLSGSSLCGADVFSLTREKTYSGQQLTYLENVLGKTNPEVLKAKENYLLISLNQYILVSKWVSICNKNITVILFFYSNKVNGIDSQNQGYVLDYIFAKYPQSVVTYAFDVDIDNPALNALKQINNIHVVPTLVINGTNYEGFQSKDKIESLLK